MPRSSRTRPVAPRHDRLAHPDGGVTVVVGLVLAIGLVTALVVNYQLNWVPNQEEQREAEHMATVADQMGALTATMGKQLLGEVNTTVTTPIDVGLEEKSWPSIAPVSHRLMLTAPATGASGVTLRAENLRLIERDGTSLAGLGERYTAVPSTNASIQTLEHARLRYSQITQTTGSVQVHLANATGANAGWLNVTIDDAESASDPNLTIRITVDDADGTRIHDDPRYHGASLPGAWFLDLLAPGMPFAQLVSAAEAPVSITTTGSPDASLTLTYQRKATDGLAPMAGGGRSMGNHTIELPSANLTYTGTNPSYVDQTYALEAGALLLAQHDGAGFLAEPPITFDKVDGNVSVGLSLPRLTAANASLAGTASVSLKTTTLETRSLEGLTSNLTLTVHTRHPGTWHAWLEDQLIDADVAATYYNLTTGPASTTLTITGDPTHTDQEEDVHVQLRHTLIRARLIR